VALQTSFSGAMVRRSPATDVYFTLRKKARKLPKMVLRTNYTHKYCMTKATLFLSFSKLISRLKPHKKDGAIQQTITLEYQ